MNSITYFCERKNVCEDYNKVKCIFIRFEKSFEAAPKTSKVNCYCSKDFVTILNMRMHDKNTLKKR